MVTIIWYVTVIKPLKKEKLIPLPIGHCDANLTGFWPMEIYLTVLNNGLGSYELNIWNGKVSSKASIRELCFHASGNSASFRGSKFSFVFIKLESPKYWYACVQLLLRHLSCSEFNFGLYRSNLAHNSHEAEIDTQVFGFLKKVGQS
jgi:hypothetical protein